MAAARAAARRIERLLILACAALLCGVVACGSSTVKSPFSTDAGSEAGAAGAAGAATQGGLDVGERGGEDPTLGGPCADDGQCDDAIDCTVDSCDEG
ncbi:MAG: hypothetical protein ABJB12_13215, partial [Pseudomonadota bacterium]